MRVMVAVAGAVATIGLTTAAAFAVSDGNYDPARQHCDGHAEDTDRGDTTQPGCKSMMIVLYDGSGHEYASYGLDQTTDGNSAKPSTDPAVTPAGGDPASGPHLYFGADDNLDNGEHDGSEQIGAGPSDGGAIRVDTDPANLATWVAAVQADPFYLLIHPIPIASAGTGACADGFCVTVQTERRTIINGDDPCEPDDLATNGETLEECQARTADRPDRQVTNYDGHNWDPESCSGPDDTPEDCGGVPLEDWNEQEHSVYADPGVSVYEDPDAQGSPIGPLYPIPALYVGTCGVVAGGGPGVQAPATPLTNGAGQLVVKSPGC